jgi:hypothetical protein
MPSQTKNPDTPSEQDAPVIASEEIKLDRLADEAAGRAARREQRYDQEHEIFVK